MKGRVFAKGPDQLPRHVLEQPAVVPALRQFVHLHKPSLATQGGFLFVQYGVIKIFLAGEVAEKDGFTNPGSSRYVLGFSAAEAVLGEALDGHPKQLPAAVLAGHSRRPDGTLAGL